MGTELERAILPSYLGRRRWFAFKDQLISAVRIASVARLPGDDPEILLSEVEVVGDEECGRWLLPLSIVCMKDRQPLQESLALARVRGPGGEELLTDAFFVDDFAHRILRSLASGAHAPTTEGVIVFESAQSIEPLKAATNSPVKWLSTEQSNSSLIVADSVMLKLFRRVVPGHHPEAEMSRYLTESGFKNCPLMLGEVVRVDREGVRHSLAVAQAFVPNQGDAWSWTLDWFNRHLENLPHDNMLGDEAYSRFAAAMGRRLGEMHVVLARATDNESFVPRRASKEDINNWIKTTRGALDSAFKRLAHAKASKAARDAQYLLTARDPIFAALEGLATRGEGSPVARIHGDFHLGQVLVVDGDAFIIDFEGEPSADLAARRGKYSPLNDVAGLLRSFDYALATAVESNAEGTDLHPEARRSVLSPILDQARRAFLEAYRASVRTLPGLEDEKLLELLLIRKAAYEIEYEAANRPAWLPLPVSGLANIVRRVLKKSARGEF